MPSSPTKAVCPERAPILGIGVSVITLDGAVSVVEEWIRKRSKHYICITGAHGVIESRRDADLRRIHNEAGLVTPDGMSLVFVARSLGFKPIARVYGPDLMRHMTELSAEKGYRQFYYGGGAGLAERLAKTLRSRHPDLVVAGTITPPFRPTSPAEDEEHIAHINATAPDIVWVGLSTPKQERWMASHVHRLNAPVLIGVGAAFDFLAGTKSQAPVWMQRNGLEWAYRLMQEPRRLWKRYAKIVPLFSVLALAQIVAHWIPKVPVFRR